MVGDAAFAASAAGIFIFCIWPQLEARRGRWVAYLVVGLAAACVPVAVALSRLGVVPTIVVPLLIGVLLLVWSAPRQVVQALGGSRPLSEDLQRVVSSITRSWELFEVGDLEGARDVVAPLADGAPARAARYLDLWHRFLDEEGSRRAGTHQSSRDTLREFAAEGARLTMPSRRLGPLLISVALFGAVVVGSAPAIAYARACVGVEFLLPSHGSDGSTQALPLATSLVTEPEPNAVLSLDEAMGLEPAAASRHDPDTRAQLLHDGFVAGQSRQWVASDGRQISADVFEFAGAAGALDYHRSVNRYACQFSNEAFGGPGDGVGLQVRFSRGDPIVEQVSWVTGRRRFVVSVGALAPPAGHERVLRLAQQQQEQALH